MTNWVRILRALLPRGRAWLLFSGSKIRAFFAGLIEGLFKPVREYIDRVYFDLFPQSTRALDDWERQWGLPNGAGLTEQERRDRLAAQWKALGGQSPRYIQDTLQGAGFDVYVHEWWTQDSDPPTPRNPLLVLSEEPGSAVITSLAGEPTMQAGEPDAQAGFLSVLEGYPLVNKLQYTQRTFGSSAGAQHMVAGNPEAVAGTFGAFRVLNRTYPVPQDQAQWRYILYIGGEVFPDVATVPASRRDEFEALCLKICPTQQWLGILVEYV